MVKRTDDHERVRLIRAARAAVGDDDDRPLSKDEERIIEEVRRENPRPSKEEIEEIASRLAARARSKR